MLYIFNPNCELYKTTDLFENMEFIFFSKCLQCELYFFKLRYL